MRDISRIPPIKIRTSSTRPNRVASREVLIAAPAGLCFETIAKQLERPASWDTLIVHVWPVSTERGRVGAMSRMLADFGGQAFISSARITQYQPDRALSWVITGYPEISVVWRLEQKRPAGTTVNVAVVWGNQGWSMDRILYWLKRKKKVGQDLEKMIAQLKNTIESNIATAKT